MKKLLLSIVLLAVVLMGCEFRDLDTTYAPPSWIRGAWADTTWEVVYTFDAYEVYVATPYNTPLYDYYKTADKVETSSDTSYVIDLVLGSQVIKYEFVKLTARTLRFTKTVDSVVTGPVLMTKD